jgi:alpha-galactosidase
MRVDRVALRWRLRPRGALRMFRHGYQSWSASGGGPIEVPPDPSLAADAPGLARAMFHADPTPVAVGETRSELVTALADDHAEVVLGFAGGDGHDGTFRVRGAELLAEAYLGRAELAGGETRDLHAVVTYPGPAAAGLEHWATAIGSAAAARTSAPYQVGWCSWYHYFHHVTEEAFRANLARAGDWPFDVFQLDDGYQAQIGDWLDTSDAFPSTLDQLAGTVSQRGYTAGLWLAPFLVSPRSRVANDHPEWLLKRASGRPAVGNVNPAWGGDVWVLDTTRTDVLEHLERVARALVRMGWRYLKLDFTYAPALDGLWHDPRLTPAQRVRQSYDAIRRGAGPDTFLLGCGAPLGPCIGVVDGMRIGPDVAPRWEVAGSLPGYADTAPATVNAWRNTLARSFMHRRLWLNDPDCLMLRTEATQLTTAQIDAWADAVAASGGMAIVSDDLGVLGRRARRRLERLVTAGRAIDDAARHGNAPRCTDLLERWTPTALTCGGTTLTGDPASGHARLSIR